jgi:hypothetical protein
MLLMLVSVACGATPPAVYQLPGSTLAIRVELQPMHPWLAEYHRTASIDLNGREVSRIALSDDTGGYPRINIYNATPTTLLMRDYFDSYAIDVATGGVTKHAQRRAGGTFVGSFDDDGSGAFRFIPPSERREMPTELR